MAKKITLNMITQRSVEEGVGIVSGKMSQSISEAALSLRCTTMTSKRSVCPEPPSK